jgi:hypothetical protein
MVFAEDNRSIPYTGIYEHKHWKITEATTTYRYLYRKITEASTLSRLSRRDAGAPSCSQILPHSAPLPLCSARIRTRPCALWVTVFTHRDNDRFALETNATVNKADEHLQQNKSN